MLRERERERESKGEKREGYVCALRSYLLRQCNIHSALWKKLLPAAGRERTCHWQNQTEVEKKWQEKNAKAVEWGTFSFVVRQSTLLIILIRNG